MSTFDSTSSHDEQERQLLILYATETGNAQDIADRVARAARRLQFRSRVMSVDCYSLVCRLMKYTSLSKAVSIMAGKSHHGGDRDFYCINYWLWH